MHQKKNTPKVTQTPATVREPVSEPDFPEVIIIGGSYSGMQAAMTLGRALRRVLIIDSGKPCNRFASHAHNLIGSEGLSPARLHQNASKQIAAYSSVRMVEDRVTDVHKEQNLFNVFTDSGRHYRSECLILATGLQDRLPEIPGIWECWGKSVIHCPYCHGYEYKGARTAVLATGDKDVHIVSLLKQWTKKLQVFLPVNHGLSHQYLDYLRQEKIRITEGQITALQQQQGMLQSITFMKRTGKTATVPMDVLYLMPAIQQSLDLQKSLGYQLDESGLISVDEGRRTSVPGLYAVGDNSCRFRSLSQAIASGMAAGAMINFDLIQKRRPLPSLH